ncbi:heterokaryon incompatibility protein-domain-containing protein [Paraphoma chrysanthemicola]|uniref:Heterokaryon incompatibility protein-domain-containing protein n=1 Tax=Paraphoma chrysanthemicola TaxID=798071 RepID=A0A8K0QZS8_9PLEO|nr:heterokaryon incompatibility protein-domain-containing protein [Paraphoma chrysanthemicola]
MDESETPNAYPAPRQTFCYEPLHRTPHTHFRLLRILPDRKDGLLQLQLWHSAQSVEYRCLSYMWGSLSDEHDILLNGRIFRVRNNLYTFLEYASQQLAEASLWIDAICINQHHDEEKAAEVSRMHEVYTGAQEILIWLGDLVMSDHAVRWLRSGTGNMATSLVKKQLLTFYGHGYWNRTWITQEILLARKITILVGSHVLDWNDVPGPGALAWEETKAAADMVVYLHYTWYMFHKDSQQRRSEATNDSTNEYTPFRFWDLLKRRHMSPCTDHRDRIYGLLALVKDEAGSFPISYHDK